MTNLCDECETVSHCLKHGCIPKQQAQQEPVAWLRKSDLVELRACNYMRLGADSPSIWAPNAPDEPSPDMELVAVYTSPQPAQQPTNCRHCGGADNVLCGGQCKEQPAPVQQKPVEEVPGMAVQALAGEIIEALLADDKDGGYDLTAGMFGRKFSTLVRRWAQAEWTSPQPAQRKPLVDGLDIKTLNHCMIAVRDWLGGGCDTNDVPRPAIAALVEFANYGIKDQP